MHAFLTTPHIMSGGHSNYKLPSYVKSPTGGWNHNPVNGRQNAVAIVFGMLVCCYGLYRSGESGAIDQGKMYSDSQIKSWNDAAAKNKSYK